MPGAGVPRCYTGAGGVVRPQSLLCDCQRTDPFVTASTAVATSPRRRPYRPTREVVTGLCPVPTDPPAPPCKFLGSPGGCQEGPTPGGLPPLPATGSTPGRQLRPRCRVSVPLPAEGVPSARHRTGGRHCLYRLESVTAPSLHRLPGTIPRGFATSRRVVVELSSFRPLQCSPGLSTPATSSG